ncbi:ABC transporter permease [Vibrio sp. SCSIO 43137]|uniref:ABC transporter permease n=1 Tax=Vibrio sp. SCSIO 43137 TaxID=3021011 RepID=UPI0023071548|nr:ABC transporter permease [Vibrio sp. SCSIO 43137]WCE28546.1 ABC transporter permease [Vibrio sp. SCSIO 43137]
MQTANDISWLQLTLFSLLLVVPLAINVFYKLELAKEMCTAIVRMVVQLTLVGLYLEYLFQLNSLTLNLLWLLVMLLVGSSAITSKARLENRYLLFPVASGLFIGLSPVLLILCFYVISPEPWYQAQYLIPVSGMLLGNSLSGNIVALQNFYGAFELRKGEYEAAISLGAKPSYACNPFVRAAMQKALAPILASMTTTGLVTLPGMMTGQILGGASPMLAIKYQLIILVAIFVMMSVSLTISLQLSIKYTINESGRVKAKFIEK